MRIERQRLFAALPAPELAIPAKRVVGMPKPRVNNTIVSNKSTKALTPSAQAEMNKVDQVKQSNDQLAANRKAALDKQQQQIADDRQKLNEMKKEMAEKQKQSQQAQLMNLKQKIYTMRIPRQRIYSSPITYYGGGKYKLKRFSTLTLEERMYFNLNLNGIKSWGSSVKNIYSNNRAAGKSVFESLGAGVKRTNQASNIKVARSARDAATNVMNESKSVYDNAVNTVEQGKKAAQQQADRIQESFIKTKGMPKGGRSVADQHLTNTNENYAQLRETSRFGNAADQEAASNAFKDFNAADKAQMSAQDNLNKVVERNTSSSGGAAELNKLNKEKKAAEEAARQEYNRKGREEMEQGFRERQAKQQAQQADQQVQQAQQQVEQQTQQQTQQQVEQATQNPGTNTNNTPPANPADNTTPEKKGLTGWQKAGIGAAGLGAAAIGTGLYAVNKADDTIKDGVNKTINSVM